MPLSNSLKSSSILETMACWVDLGGRGKLRFENFNNEISLNVVPLPGGVRFLGDPARLLDFCPIHICKSLILHL